MRKFSFKAAITRAALILLFAATALVQPTSAQERPNHLIGSWRVSVAGEPRDRVFTVQGAEARSDGTIVLKGRYGFIDGNRGAVTGEISYAPQGRKLTMTTTAASVIVATQVADDVFSGNISYRNGVVKTVTLTRTTEAELATRRPTATAKAAPTTVAPAPTPVSDADIEAAIGKRLSTGSVPDLQAVDNDDLDDITAGLSAARMRELQTLANAQAPLINDKQALCIFYHRRGVAHLHLGNYPRAVEDLRSALANNVRATGNPEEWGDRYRIQYYLGLVFKQSGDIFSAIDHFHKLAQEYPVPTNAFRYHLSALHLASLYLTIGDFVQAGKMLAAANDTIPRMRASSLWQTGGMGQLHRNSVGRAEFFAQQGQYTQAEGALREALDYAQKNLDLRVRTMPEEHASINFAFNKVANAHRHLATLFALEGRHGEAEVHARAGFYIGLTRHGLHTVQIANFLGAIGNAKLQQGDVAGSEWYFRHALAATEGSGVMQYSIALAVWRAAVADALLLQGRWNEAFKFYDQRDRGLRSDPVQFERIGSAHVGWAYALLKTGRSEDAATMAAAILDGELKRPVPDRWYLAQLRGVFGMALAASGRTTEALQAFRESVLDLIRRDQDDAMAENTGYWRAFWKRVILEGYLELLAKLHAVGEAVPGLDLVDESFRTADIARGSLVQEAIAATAARAQLPDKNLAELARKENDAWNRIGALNKVLSYLASTREHEQRAKLISDVQADIARLRKERAQLHADISKRYPEYAELTDPKPVGIAETRKALRGGEALISIYIGESQSYVWTTAPDGRVAFRVIAIKREEIEADVAELRRAVDFGDGTPNRMRPFDLARAHKLYSTYFEPDEAMWRDVQVLNVIAHGALGQIPVSLLVTEAPKAQPMGGAVATYAEVQWLIRKVGIAQLPSASALAALRRTPAAKAARQPFIGFGDPLFTNESVGGDRRSVVRDLAVRKITDPTEVQLDALAQGKSVPDGMAPALATRTLAQAFAQVTALPDTADELKEIAAVLKADANRDVFINRRATERNVKQTPLANRRVVAFATHGIAPGELTGLDQPALVLSNPALTGDTENDGFLTMEEVLGLKLDADWVVLSACNTASADGKGSEAVSGLGRAFFYAGARSLLVSNWAVETTSAKLLTTELFTRQSENPQLTRAEALRQSMLDLMSKKSPAGFSYAHPAFWAPFSLVGDGGR